MDHQGRFSYHLHNFHRRSETDARTRGWGTHESWKRTWVAHMIECATSNPWLITKVGPLCTSELTWIYGLSTKAHILRDNWFIPIAKFMICPQRPLTSRDRHILMLKNSLFVCTHANTLPVRAWASLTGLNLISIARINRAWFKVISEAQMIGRIFRTLLFLMIFASPWPLILLHDLWSSPNHALL